MRIVGISGSLRRDSYNSALLLAAARVLPPGAELVEYRGLKALPPFCEDDEAAPCEAVVAFRDAISSADALLIATPEYNSSIPGALKNALDWASRPRSEAALRGKPAAVVGASTGTFGAIWGQAETRKALSASGAQVLDRELAVANAATAFTAAGRLTDRGLEAALRRLLIDLWTLVDGCDELATAA